MNDKIIKIPVDKIFVVDQLHRLKDKAYISELAESIHKSGQLHNLTVRKEGAKYIVLAGRNRTAAMKEIQQTTGKKVKANVRVIDTDKLSQELIAIDENLIRKNLTDIEEDEALFRRKQIYEELYPETKQYVAAAQVKHKNKSTKAFTVDAATKLKRSRRTIENSIARASKASSLVKKARSDGSLSPTKVNLLVGLSSEEQDLLLPLITKKNVNESKKVIERAKKIGAKATVLYINEEEGDLEDSKELKMIVRESMRLEELIDDAIKARLSFQSKAKFDHIRSLERLVITIDKFTDYQRAAQGSRLTIRRRGSDQKFIRAAAR